MRVEKRDGTVQRWDRKKIEYAMLKAFKAVHPFENVNVQDYAMFVEDRCKGKNVVNIEEIQSLVVEVLEEEGKDDVAAAYREYAYERLERRHERVKPDAKAISDFIAVSKYAQHRDGRRETWEETCDRVQAMHERKFGFSIADAFHSVRNKRVLASMRSMQFGGLGIERHNVRMYNCSFTLANRLRFFQELFYNLLCGCGCGFSVQFQHVDLLPEVKTVDRDNVAHFTVNDDIEGWADSVGHMIKCYFITGEYPEFNYSKIRPKGAPLSTSGGRAPGHLPLKKLHDQLREQLDAASFRKLRPIEIADLSCKIAEAVLAGGIRRSSMIVLFSPEDGEMAHAKVPGNFEWKGKNYWRRMMNISACCIRNQTSRDTIERLIRLARSYGDPGIYWTSDPDCGCNPCGEIGFYPVLADVTMRPAGHDLGKEFGLSGDGMFVVTRGGRERFMCDASMNYNPDSQGEPVHSDDVAIQIYGHATGWQFCNLTEINAAMCLTIEDFLRACADAAEIGTLQAAYTDMPYLGPVTERIVRREALIGVGITGMCDSPEIAFDPKVLREGAAVVKRVNEQTAERIGIHPAARLTTVKPSGTSSLLLGCVGSGIHPHHARRYFRRVIEPKTNVVAKYFAEINPHMVEEYNDDSVCITFCVEAPGNAVTVKELRAVDFMDQIFNVYDNWIIPGQAYGTRVTNNVSCTVVVGEDEWDEVIEKFWNERARIASMAFLPRMGDKGIPFIPREEIVTPADEARWDYLCSNYEPVDYTQMVELVDTTAHSLEAACVGGQCEV